MHYFQSVLVPMLQSSGGSLLTSIKQYHTDTTVKFVIEMTEESQRWAVNEGIEKTFKLTSSFSTDNLVLFDWQGKIKKYDSADEILKEFYINRLPLYQQRKEHYEMLFQAEIKLWHNRVRFIAACYNHALSATDPALASKLETLGFDSNPVSTKDKFGYLLSMKVSELTLSNAKHLKKEMDQKKHQLSALQSKTASQLWKEEIMGLVAFYDASLISGHTSTTNDAMQVEMSMEIEHFLGQGPSDAFFGDNGGDKEVPATQLVSECSKIKEKETKAKSTAVTKKKRIRVLTEKEKAKRRVANMTPEQKEKIYAARRVSALTEDQRKARNDRAKLKVATTY